MNLRDHREKILQWYALKVDCRILQARGLRTFFLSAGQGSPVILLHGAGAGAVAWAPVMAHLAAQFRVIAPDLPGFGESAKPVATYDREFFASWLMAFMDQLKIEQTSLIGNSNGGAVAVETAIRDPRRVRHLVLANPAGFGVRGVSTAGLVTALWFHLRPSPRRCLATARYLLNTPSRFPKELAYLLAVVRSDGGKRFMLLGKGRSAAPFSRFRLARIRARTLIVWGAQDRLLARRHAHNAHRLIPGAHLAWMPEAAHVPFMEHPDIFNQKVTRFLTGHTHVKET